MVQHCEAWRRSKASTSSSVGISIMCSRWVKWLLSKWSQHGSKPVANGDVLACHRETQEASAIPGAAAGLADQYSVQRMKQEQHGQQVLDRCSASLPDQQLEQLHPSQQPVQLALQDLPKPWQRAFMASHLNNEERLALFQVSRATAATVVQHCLRLHLHLRDTLLHSNRRRSYVLNLASGCTDISLSFGGQLLDEDSIVSLDAAAVWPCITQLYLADVGLNSHTIASLHVGQLTKLRSISLSIPGPGEAGINRLDVAAVQRLVQAGGLPALRQVDIGHLAQQVDARPLLRQLGAVLGHQVVKMSLPFGDVQMFEVVDSWPALQHVSCEERTYLLDLGRRDTSAAVKQVLSHPQLKTVTTSGTLFSSSKATISSSSRQLELLHLTDDFMSDRLLLSVPTHAVQHLKLHAPVLTTIPATAAVQHLRKCSKVEVMPHEWYNYWSRSPVNCVKPRTPTVKAVWDPEWLSCFLPACNGLQGALILSAYSGMAQVTMAKLSSLALVPAGVHTLALECGTLAKGCTWLDFMAHIPNHIQVLVLPMSDICETDLRAARERAPPKGLKHLHLARDWGDMS